MLFRKLFNNKKSNRKMLEEEELRRRSAIAAQIKKQKVKEKLQHEVWLYKHKKEYIKNLKRRNPKLYWRWKLTTLKLPFILDFVRWVIIDILRGKKRSLWGVYIFVANPGEGKTLSMVKHIEDKLKQDPKIKIYTNFNYKGETGQIKCWQDIVRADENSIIAIDEAHLTFESTDFKNFPPEILAQLSLNRKLRKQFICSTQRYERLNKNFRDLANYVVLCKNHFKLDRWFTQYYFPKINYEAQFDGKRAKAEYVRPYIATDKLYSKYNTLQLVERLTEEVDMVEVKENKLLPLLNNILELDDQLDQKDIKSILLIRDKVLTDINNKTREDHLKLLLDKVNEFDETLKKEIEKIL